MDVLSTFIFSDWIRIFFRVGVFYFHDKLVPFTMVLWVFTLQMEERPPSMEQIYWISSRGQPTRGCSPAWRLGEVLTIPHRKNVPCHKPLTKKKWRKLVHAVMNVLVPQNEGNFLTSSEPVSFSEGLCSMEYGVIYLCIGNRGNIVNILWEHPHIIISSIQSSVSHHNSPSSIWTPVHTLTLTTVA